jgi:hypothetical protein
MTRLVVLVSLAAAVGAVAAPVPKETDAARLRRIYGVPDDPDKDAKFEMNGDQLRITIPARRRPLDDGSPEPQLPGSPRAWHEVEGDFTAVVRVSVPPHPDGTEGTLFGGLVAWADHGDHIAVGRSESVKGRFRWGEGFHLVYTFPGSVRTSDVREPKPDEAAFVRLKRQGKTVMAGRSRDGKAWTDFLPDETGWGNKLKVGVYAKNLSASAVVVAFDRYSLTLPKK